MKLLAQETINYLAVPGYTAAKGLLAENYVRTIIRTLLGLAGVGAFIFLLWGGAQWIMAGGDKDAIDKARKKVMGALVGLLIVFSSYAIMYVIQTLFGTGDIGWTINPLGS